MSSQSVMAQAIPDASFEDGCNGTELSVSGSLDAFNKFLAANPTGCKLKDKIYSAFEFTSNFNTSTTQVQISQSSVNPLQHSIKLSDTTGFQPGPYTFAYDIAVDTTVAPHFFLKSWFTTSEAVDPFSSSYTLTTDTDKSSPTITIVFPPDLNSAILTAFEGHPTKARFTNSLTAFTTGPNGFTNTVNQAEKIKEVPGPLPLFGAAAAFGFSRKLRTRIKSIA